MLSLRLLTIASLIRPNAKVLDVGTDHAYLPIYLKENNLCKSVIASDVSEKALEGARRNLERFGETDIKLILSDGLNEVKDEFDTLVISGMGTYTICNILTGKELPKYIILSSNNNLEELRSFMNKLEYKIMKEVCILDKGKYYDIISYEKGKEKLSKKVLAYGKSHDKKYYKYLYNNEKRIYKELNFKNKLKNLPKLLRLKFLSI